MIPILAIAVASLIYITERRSSILPAIGPTLRPQPFHLKLNATVKTCSAIATAYPEWTSETVCEDGCNYNYKNHSRGYVLSLSYYDQQVSASGRLLNLQCWAGEQDMVVVEPFLIEDTKLGAPLSLEKKASELIKFSDVYDINRWNAMASVPLVSWKQFVDYAPREIVFVHFASSCSLMRSVDHELTNGTMSFLEKHHFHLCRNICIVMKTTRLKWKQLNDILKFSNTSGITIIFTLWKGLEGDSVCNHSHEHWNMAPSQKVGEDAERYIKKYFNGSNYIAVMVRFERILRSKSNLGRNTTIVATAVKKALQSLYKTIETSHIKDIFLSLDIGRFSSEYFTRTYLKKTIESIMEQAKILFKTLYGESSSFEKWEDSFVNISGTTQKSYISSLQTAIAVRAKCIILVGGGQFQSRALQVYTNLHPNKTMQCKSLLRY